MSEYFDTLSYTKRELQKRERMFTEMIKVRELDIKIYKDELRRIRLAISKRRR